MLVIDGKPGHCGTTVGLTFPLSRLPENSGIGVLLSKAGADPASFGGEARSTPSCWCVPAES